MKLNAVDLFCGAGGLSCGLVPAGFEVVGAVDNWDVAIKSYQANFPTHPAWAQDIASLSKVDLLRRGIAAQIDLLAGGPPCQGFSIQRIGEDVDERNELVLSFARLVAKLQPRMFLMENVPGFLGIRGKATAKRFFQRIEAAGYETSHTILDASDYGVPQSRKRVFVVGWQRGLPAFAFPPKLSLKKRVVRDAISDLPSPPENFLPTPDDPLHRRTRMSTKNYQRLSLIPPGGGFEDLPIELRVQCHKSGAAKIGHRNVYGRLDADKPASTITARFDSFTRGKFGHPWEHRNITLREGARLQTFPDSHVFFGTQEEIAAQIGNAIPPRLAEVLGRAIRQHLCGEPSRLPDQLSLRLSA